MTDETTALPIVRLGPSDLSDVMALHDLAHRTLPAPGLLAVESPEFFQAHVEDKGRIFGMRTPSGQLAAYCVLGLPRAEDDYNFAGDLGWSPDRRAGVAHLDGAIVDPTFRGHGFHVAMANHRIDIARALGRKDVLSTAAPANQYSLQTLLDCGLSVIALRRKFGGHWRFILHADISGSPAIPRGDSLIIRSDAVERIAELLAQGYVGIAAAQADQAFALQMARPRQ